jgi:hypothetical protein
MKSHVSNMSFHLGACFRFIFKYKENATRIYLSSAFVTIVT